MDNTIQFIANYGDWKAIKKLKIEEKTDPRAVMEFLASLGMGLDRKIAENLGKTVELEKLDAALKELPKGKTEQEIASIISEVNSRKVGSAIKEICSKPELQPKEQKELQQFCRVYAMRKALSECGLSVDYSSVDVPGMGRLKKTKV
ncbi:MAG: DUF2666 family protein [Candidatus Diapherotrites archaeon]|uniref:DUF2666 family protein n=1 Tax=Candidatus Iainarchaeum sp. TaxID=3101447 RepID=A0A938YS13_9ARCH|nr:DUF2666 family protein [Candidatus Diapherotrites archaeon]